MSEEYLTPFSSKCEILTELWLAHRDDEAFSSIIEYGDLGIPLAFAISQSIVEETPIAKDYIEDVWQALLGLLEIDEGKIEFTFLSDLIDYSDIDLMNR